MDKNYDHLSSDKETLNRWDKSGVFTPPSGSEAKEIGLKPFTIIMPPPNANEPLHVGHAMFVTVEDILIRYHRMLGEASLWLPGTDHAGIETQFVFEKKLAKIGKSRYDFDRKTLYEMIESYVKENSGIAVEQMKRLGASADWSRYKFTLDEDIVDLVFSTFVKLYEDEKVYRGERLVNYCVRCGTSYSELEVEHEERDSKLYYIKYPLNSGGFIPVATTRPETMLGDTAVAVNPKDKRYKALIGKSVKLPLSEREIPIIADEMVDVEFGTGAVKITPAHDPADYDAGLRHNLERIQVIDFDGRMMANTGDFRGMKAGAAREEVVKQLTDTGLIDKIVDYRHTVGTCYRCHSTIEPLPFAQFFIKTKHLADKALKALEDKDTIILGAGRDKILKNWLKNIRDWNISRQIVWGIRIPVWYDCESNPNIVVSFINKKSELVRGKVGELLSEYDFKEIELGLQTIRAAVETPFVVSKTKPEGTFLQETDTFDTWFSSGQWPVVTLKAGKKGDFEFYYPTNVMETAYDILTFWVMRMMLFGIYLTGKSPFKSVYLHGLVRDEQGRKMSKSIGNVVNPLDLVDKYGADALRMALVMSTTAGSDSNVGESKVRGMRNFTNKIWNASRFVIEFGKKYEDHPDLINRNLPPKTDKSDDDHRKHLQEVVNKVTRQLDQFKIGLAAETVYNEFWHWYCDEIIEKAKVGKISHESLRDGLIIFLKLLHPFTPFVTERLWREIGNKGLIANSNWPFLEKG